MWHGYKVIHVLCNNASKELYNKVSNYISQSYKDVLELCKKTINNLCNNSCSYIR